LSVSRLALQTAPVDSSVVVKKVERIEAEDDQFSRYNINREPPTLCELMSLLFRDEFSPYIQVRAGPQVRASVEDVVRKDVIVAECRYDWDGEIVVRVVVMVACVKDLLKLLRNKSVQANDLFSCSRNLFVIVVTSRIACPDDKVNRVSDLLIYPIECRVDKRDGRVAIRSFRSIISSRAVSSMTGITFFGRRVGLVEAIGMEIWSRD